jgi:hypothetical protein
LQRVLNSFNSSFNTNNKEDFININKAKVKKEVKIKVIINAIRAKAYIITLTINYTILIEKAFFNLIKSLFLTFKALN